MTNPYAPRDDSPSDNSYPPLSNGYPPASIPPPAYPIASPYADVGARFVALLLDFLVMFVLMTLLGIGLLWNDVSNWITAMDRWDGHGASPEFPMGGFYLLSIVGMLVWFAYRTGMETYRGQTLGKLALKIKVVDINGNHPTFSASLIRNSWYFLYAVLSLLPLFGWILQFGVPVAMAITIGTHVYRQSFTDRWAKTYVVRVQ